MVTTTKNVEGPLLHVMRFPCSHVYIKIFRRVQPYYCFRRWTWSRPFETSGPVCDDDVQFVHLSSWQCFQSSPTHAYTLKSNMDIIGYPTYGHIFKYCNYIPFSNHHLSYHCSMFKLKGFGFFQVFFSPALFVNLLVPDMKCLGSHDHNDWTCSKWNQSMRQVYMSQEKIHSGWLIPPISNFAATIPGLKLRFFPKQMSKCPFFPFITGPAQPSEKIKTSIYLHKFLRGFWRKISAIFFKAVRSIVGFKKILPPKTFRFCPKLVIWF